MKYRVRILSKINITELADEKVMIDFETGKYFLLKGVACDICEMLSEDITVKMICDGLLKEYDIDMQTCYAEVLSFLKNMEEQGFIKLERLED